MNHLHPTNGQSQPDTITKAQPATQHTPGPWMADGFNVIEAENYKGRWLVASAAIRPEREANARLIAAAPEMEQAIADILEVFGDWSGYTDAEHDRRVEALRAAHAKATKQ